MHSQQNKKKVLQYFGSPWRSFGPHVEGKWKRHHSQPNCHSHLMTDRSCCVWRPDVANSSPVFARCTHSLLSP